MARLTPRISISGKIAALALICLVDRPAHADIYDLSKLKPDPSNPSQSAERPAAASAQQKDTESFERGLQKFRVRNWQGAIEEFSRCIQANPRDYPAYTNRALARRSAGDTTGALMDLSQAIKLKPDYTTAIFNRAVTRRTAGDRSGSLQDFDLHIQLKPTADAYFQRASVKFEGKDWNGAVQDYTQSLRLRADASAYRNRAAAKRNLKDDKGALEDLNIAARLSPDNDEVYYERALVKRSLKDDNGCIQDLNEAIRLDPADAWSYYQRAYTRDDMGDKRGSVEDLNEAIRLKPDFADAYRNRYVSRRDLGDKNNPDWDIYTSLSINPKTPNEYWSWAWGQTKIGKYKEALQGWNEYFRLKQTNPNPTIYFNRGECRSVLGDANGAIADFTEAINLKPAFADAYNGRAWERIALNDFAGAQEDATRAISLEAKNAACAYYYDTRAWAKFKGGDRQGALRDLDEAIKLNPKLAEAISKRALVKTELKDAGGANFDLITCSNLAPDNGSVLKVTAQAKRIMGDTRGALADFNKAAKCLQRDGRIAEYEKLMKEEQSWLTAQAEAAPTTSAPTGTQSTTQTTAPTPAAPAIATAPMTAAPATASPMSAASPATTNHTQQIPADRSASRPVADKWALVVGISKFAPRQTEPTVRSLKYAAKDATDFYKFLIDTANFKPDHVRLLLNEKATREQILTELGSRFLPRVAGEDDLVVVYLSTHGSSSSDDISGANYIIAYDSKPENLYPNAIEMQQIMQGIMKKRVRSDRVLLIMDTCYSGAAEGGKGTAVGNVDAEAIAQTTGRVVISSSSRNQRSFESHQYPNGVFTRKLIEVFTRFGVLQPLSKVFPYVRKAVEDEVRQDEGHGQTPTLSPEENNLILGAIPTEPRAISPILLKALGPDSSSLLSPTAAASKSKNASP